MKCPWSLLEIKPTYIPLTQTRGLENPVRLSSRTSFELEFEFRDTGSSGCILKL